MKCPAAVSLGRLGGHASAKTRMDVTTPEDRVRWAQNAARKRWLAERLAKEATAKKHAVVDPIDKGIVRRPNGTEVHLWECRVCGVRVVGGRGRRWQHFTNDGRSRGAYKTSRQSDLRWPYGHDESDLVLAINEAVPRNLPEQVREEACQELALAVLEGKTTLAQLADAARGAMAAARSGYQFSARFEVSMDIPLGQDARSPLKDLLAASEVEGVARVVTETDDLLVA